jgi:hypothetical protein
MTSTANKEVHQSYVILNLALHQKYITDSKNGFFVHFLAHYHFLVVDFSTTLKKY